MLPCYLLLAVLSGAVLTTANSIADPDGGAVGDAAPVTSDAAVKDIPTLSQNPAAPSVIVQPIDVALEKLQESLKTLDRAGILPPDPKSRASDDDSEEKPTEQQKPVHQTYGQVFSRFISDLLKAPIEMLQAFSDVIRGLTGAKRSITPATKKSADEIVSPNV